MKPDDATKLQPATDTSVALAKRLRSNTRGEVLFDAASRGRYATDASIYQVMPVGVFVPTDDADVRAAIQIARELKVPVLPRGAGTSQCGQTVGACLVIDGSKHLRNVLALDVERRSVRVQPGLVLDHLNAQLKGHGLWFPVDVSTSAQATLGGMAGNNSCGSRSIAYGNMVHNVIGAHLRLADDAALHAGPVGTCSGRAAEAAQFVRALAYAHRADIEAHWPRVMRRVGGYNLDIFHPRSERPYTANGNVNLAHLLIGAEGTLGFIEALDLRLQPLPRAKVLGIVNFASFHRAMDSAQHIVKLSPSAVELVDRTMIELARANPAFKPVIESALIGEPEAILLVEFSGDDRNTLRRALQQLVELMGDLGLAGSVVPMPDDAPQKALWEVRKAGLNIMMSLKGDGKPVSFIEDCAVPLQHLAEYTAALTDVFARHGTRGTWYAHASVGTLHVRPILDMRRDGAQKMRAIADEAAELVRKFKGAYSGEHGDGLCRGEWIRWQFGPRLDDAFRAIKQHIDPENLFCPRRIVDPPKMDDAALFRFPPAYRTIELKPVFDWSAWNVQNDPVTESIGAPGTGGDSTAGFAKAVEMCNNNGHCRKFDAGTMCPSYRVTRDEQHLTRGRANTLRLALSGQLGADALTSQAVLDALDLCVGCKGCKRDCPTGVDMARMKFEVQAQRRRRHGATLKDRLIGGLPDYAPWASRMPWLFNLRNRSPALARVLQRWTGLSAQRRLPTWRRDTFMRHAGGLGLLSRQALLAAHAAGSKAVVLWTDTFSEHFEPEIPTAAVQVLQAAGYAVHLARSPNGRVPCCGRTHLAAGDMHAAQIKARVLLSVLQPLVEQGLPIVGLEPSCLLTLRDEYLVMGLGEAAQRVAEQALLFEEFVVREAQAGRFTPRWHAAGQPMRVHGHCHQKALGLIDATPAALRLIPGAQVSLIESSCCGMAGSFGYEAAHQEVSMRMAELTLLPALRAAKDCTIVASGTSCRHQIADGASIAALHVAQVLAAHLTEGNTG
ncbi:MAG: FAD-binding protein [Burkholderiaceae bacterium]|nr:FAD-binding protein [Burkholderiaceae bacterium]